MIEITEEEFQGDIDKYTSRIQDGEAFLLRKKNGNAYLAVDLTKFDHAQCDI